MAGKGRFYKADEQARRLVILFSNKLKEKMYLTTAPLLGLPAARQARAKDMNSSQHVYFPGINKMAFVRNISVTTETSTKWDRWNPHNQDP